MRNWQPHIADTVRKMAEDGITHAVVICLAPHNSRTSVGLYAQALRAAATSVGKRKHRRLPEAMAVLPVFHSRLISSRAGMIIRC